MRGFKGLELKYGIEVVSEGEYYNPLNGKWTETFKIYTADGCCWEKGLSRAGVKRECEEWADDILRIRDLVMKEEV